jgi:DNA-binding GntR family transcriptional regulator
MTAVGDGPVSAVQRAMDLIRERIRSDDWGPGYRLVEGDLTAELGISRGPLREAFNRLAAEGLLTVQPHRGVMVLKLSADDLSALYQVREVLEGLAARLVAGRSGEPEIRAAMEEHLRLMREVEPGKSPASSYFDENSRFHSLLIELSGNPHLRDATRRFETQLYRYSMRRLLQTDSIKLSWEQHLAVIEAILAGDEDAAERIMREHVCASGAAVQAALPGRP